ncbi:LamG domain-containing protein [Halorientalis halophila]|uniref:LamG domain-containing protein n=1 Tax=Halorientalis halophila TaxID=3108499 RepID=UPI00300AF386
MHRRRLLSGLGTLCLGSGILVVGTDALTSSEAERTSDVDVVGDSDAFLQANVESAQPLVVGDGSGSSDVQDLATVTNQFPTSADITFVDQDTSDSIVFYDGGEVSSPYTFSSVAADSSVSIDVDLNGSSKDTFNFTIRGETGDTTVTLDESFDTGGIDGLLGYYPFEDSSDKDPGTMFDESGNDNDGTLNDGPDHKTGQVGQSREFINDDYGQSLALDGTFKNSSFTVSIWTKPGDENDDQLLFGLFTSQTAEENFSMETDGGDQTIKVTYDYASGTYLHSTSSVNEDTFHHAAVTYDHDTAETTIYYNGNSEATDTVGTFTGDSPDITIGNWDWDGSNYDYFNANVYLDEFRVYNRALSESEIQKIYDATK